MPRIVMKTEEIYRACAEYLVKQGHRIDPAGNWNLKSEAHEQDKAKFSFEMDVLPPLQQDKG